MIYLHLVIASIVLQTVHLLPMEVAKRDRKRSIDVYLKPFDIEYEPLHVPSDVPVSFQETIQFWNSLSEGPPNHGIVSVPYFGELDHGHFPPFLNDEGYNDPHLLKGSDAKRAALISYSKELFFSDFPHAKALLENQEKRNLNGLAGNRLGSLRPNSPFYRNSYNF